MTQICLTCIKNVEDIIEKRKVSLNLKELEKFIEEEEQTQTIKQQTKSAKKLKQKERKEQSKQEELIHQLEAIGWDEKREMDLLHKMGWNPNEIIQPIDTSKINMKTLKNQRQKFRQQVHERFRVFVKTKIVMF